MTTAQKGRKGKRKETRKRSRTKTGTKTVQSNGSRTQKKNKERRTSSNDRTRRRILRKRERNKIQHRPFLSASGKKGDYSRNKTTGAIRRRRGEGKEKQLTTRTSREEPEQEDYIIKDDIGYSDDAQLFMEKDDHRQMFERLGSYDISKEARELEKQWINVIPLVHAGSEPGEEMPPPFGQIKFSQ